MKHPVRGGLTMLAAALLVACAAHTDKDATTRLSVTSESVRDARANPNAPEIAKAAIPVARAPSEQAIVAQSTNQPTNQLDQIVVTEQRRHETLQEAPIAVSVLSSDSLSRKEKRDLKHLTAAAKIEAPPAPISVAPNVAYSQPTNTEQYQHQDDNPVHLVREQPVSTFSIDVDTGAYANVRRFLNAGQLPPHDAVRVEEMINYFDYQYTPPTNRTTPFRVSTELAHAPWNPESLLLRIGIKGYEIAASERPASNLVFLIDVSGSMESPDKMPLLKNAFHLLTDQLTEKDTVSIVVYAGNTGVVLEPTPGNQKHKILAAIDKLEAGGSTNGGDGIKRAYQLAHESFIKKGINRVILATDGDFNVGVVNFEALVNMVEHERQTGVALTSLGFGTGNYNDKLMERLADAGNGNYAYVDTLKEARKVFVSELSSTLFMIAKDVKIQVEFNPAEVLEYRLIGYENRVLAREDFNNDKVDAGDIGAGHRVTALYEIVPAHGKGLVDPLRYGATKLGAIKSGEKSGELANVKLRYKQPNSDISSLLEYPIVKTSLVTADNTSADFKLAASVAAFGQLLRGGKYVGRYSYDDVAKLAKTALSNDDEGYRRDFVSLVKLAESLSMKNAERVGKIGR